ncbi:MAG: ATP-binding protein [Gammaproteobacteria bacterium]|nr:ATP-binding protein [Gammaproteobacteria bacterium]
MGNAKNFPEEYLKGKAELESSSTPSQEPCEDVSEDPASRNRSAATTLVEIAEDQYDFGVSTTGETFALPKRGPKVVSMLRGNRNSIRGQLAIAYFRKYRRASPQQALADALLVLEGLAHEAEESELYLRVAQDGDGLWLDLGDQTGRAIQISAAGWDIVEPPVLFKRTVLMSSLPEPERGGSLDDLWAWLNVVRADRPLVLAALVAALHRDVAHPVLAFFGEQGTGKTTAQKMLVNLIDPGPVPTRKPPRDAESWVTAAAGSWIVGLDNLSDVQPWLSDSICRAVTGDGDVRRKLYTDGEHAIFAYRRFVCLNSIDLGAVRGDLAERMLPIHLETIPPDKRLDEQEIWPAWEQAHPHILGALLDLAASVERTLPSVELVSRPRMSDFARILAAVDKVLGVEGLARYLEHQNAMATDSLTGDSFIVAVESLGHFHGTAGELRDKVTPDKPPRGWPTDARAVTQRLRRQAPVMRKAGWRVEDDEGRNHSKAIRWTITAPNHAENARRRDPQDPQTRKGESERVSAGVAGEGYGVSQDDYEPGMDNEEVVL